MNGDIDARRLSMVRRVASRVASGNIGEMDTPGSGSDSSDSPAPGWYPDPDSPSLRWWDGNNWSDTVVAVPQSQPPPPTDNPVPASSHPRQSSPPAPAQPSIAAQLFRRHWKRLLLDTVLLLVASFLLLSVFRNLGTILGGSPGPPTMCEWRSCRWRRSGRHSGRGGDRTSTWTGTLTVRPPARDCVMF
ncbi:DUF2510 domain-containing protein [Rhodococcus erythropolis]|nr:DUF2510 domain-containing protein [Rhodococcus erythropolis]